MGFKCGIVGLPNVGKSTLFNALTKAGIQAGNYPFCTIDPNVGVVPVPDTRLQTLAEIVNPQNILPATMEFVDIAGLVEGASKGEGLGNKFLANIRETDAIAHVVRCFENDNVVHVDGQVNPLHDIAVIDTELLLADMDTVEKAVARAAKHAKSANKEYKAQIALLERLSTHIEAGNKAATFSATEQEQAWVKPLCLLTAKPTLYVANLNEDGFQNNSHLNAVREFASKEGAIVVPICAAIEAEIAELEPDDAREFLESLNLQEPGLHRLIRVGYCLLGLQTYFTAGVKEVCAWTIPIGATAPQAAGKIHTDFEKGFIRAEVIGYDDYLAGDGEQGAKEAGKWRLEGKDYIVQDGDVVHFRFNT